MAVIGNAPCAGCRLHIYEIHLVPASEEPADDGGTWHRAEPGQSCPSCGEPLRWYHVPAPRAVEFSTVAAILETVPSDN